MTEYLITKQLVKYTAFGIEGVALCDTLETYANYQEAYDNYFKLKDNYTDFVVNSNLEIGKDYYCYAIEKFDDNEYYDTLNTFYMGVE